MSFELIIVLSLLLLTFTLYFFYLNSSRIKLNYYSLFKKDKIKKITLLKHQGHCNINYLLETPKNRFLLRKFKYSNQRKAEFYIQNRAHKKNLAAKAHLLDEKNSLMICNFIEGEHQHKLSQQNLKKLAVMLQKLHRIKIQQQPNTFRQNFKPKNRKVHEAFNVVNSFKKEYVLGHNDLHARNILFGKKIQFIDWEYAGRSDRYFDLVSIILEFKLNKGDEKSFLRSYFGRKSVNQKKLNAFKVIYRELWKIWFGNLERGGDLTI